MSKANIIRLELYREKKRKGSSSDYYKIMELKLLELLDYILQNEDDYVGLDAPTKMREVLKNLDSFKGKTIDG